MKPISLEMTAFGSFIGPVTIPFSDFRDGLYLITGETGAGKTTIFDAMMFALYGVASGKDRRPDQLHSDAVPGSVDTIVRFRFLQNGKEYQVTRRIHFPRKRGAEDTYGEPTYDALLTGPDMEPVNQITKVTARCEELIGMDHDQFRKIVMLAQGEFRDFLKADSDRKNEILGKLFDSSLYVRYRDLLTAARDGLRSQRAAVQDSVRQVLADELELPAGIAEEDRGHFIPGDPLMIPTLERLIEQEETETERFRLLQETARREQGDIQKRLGAADEIEQQFRSLRGREEHAEQLEQQQPEMARRHQRLLRTEAALYRVMPGLEKASEAEKRYRDREAAEKERSAACERLRAEMETAAEFVRKDGEESGRLEEMEHAIRQITDQLPRYAELTEVCRQLEEAEGRKRKAEAEKTKAEEELSFAEEHAEELKRALAGMEDAEMMVLQTEEQRREALSRLESFAGNEGVRAESREVFRMESRLEGLTREILEAAETAAAAETRHHDLYQRFLAGQAGVLAGELAEQLEQEGTAVCPVCRSTLQRDRIGLLAVGRHDTPRQEEVDAAREEYLAAEKRRDRLNRDADILRDQTEARKALILTGMQRLLPACTEWEQLIADGYQDAAEAEFRAEVRKTEQRHADAVSRAEKKKSLSREREKTESGVPGLREHAADLANKVMEEHARAERYRAAAEELRRHLSFGSEEEAAARKAAMEDACAVASARHREHRDLLAECEKQLSAAEALLQELQASKPALKEQSDEAAAEALQTMEREGFGSRDEVLSLLAEMTDGDVWIRKERGIIAEYENDRLYTAEELGRLRESLRGKERENTEELRLALDEQTRICLEADEGFQEIQNRTRSHKAVREKLIRYTDMLRATEHMWARIERLGDLAAGTAGEGGKLSFDRYVMGTVFREVLSAANQRMDIISGGKYELLHRVEADRRNAKAGLEIDVLDVGTGKRRSSATLSGGEAFFTSLALALGLSDVVQRHAGGKKLEALFIDEGFGSLSDDVLEKALEVLDQLTEGDRSVGIISHVDKLAESIPQKIRVNRSKHGSVISMELA